jgi:putative transposase
VSVWSTNGQNIDLTKVNHRLQWAGSLRVYDESFAMSNRLQCARLLAFVTGLVNQELLLRNEYLLAENRILRAQLPNRLRLTNEERRTLAEIAKRLGRKVLQEIACVAKPDTLLRWFQQLVAKKFDGSRRRRYPGRPRVAPEIEVLVVRLARENRSWGYDRIVGALTELGYSVADQTVGNILRRHSLAPAPERSRTTNWKEFIRTHWEVLAGVDFFSVELLTWRGLAAYYVLFFIHLSSRRVSLGGFTRHPDSDWMRQVARNATLEGLGYLNGCLYLLHDRDAKFCREFRDTLAGGGVECTVLPARSPNLNAHAERWVRSVKSECLSKLILFGEGSLRRALSEFLQHYHSERPHQGKNNQLLFPTRVSPPLRHRGRIECHERLGGLLKYYQRAA